MKEFTAPWSKSLWLMSILTTLACCLPYVLKVMQRGVPAWAAIVCLLGMPCAALFIIRSYTVTDDSILIKRLLWTTRLPLAGLESARIDPAALVGSLKTFGNGGFYSFTGWYWNSTVRTYQAFVTDPKRSVILKYTKRTIVISPGEPKEFVNYITKKIGITDNSGTLIN